MNVLEVIDHGANVLRYHFTIILSSIYSFPDVRVDLLDYFLQL